MNTPPDDEQLVQRWRAGDADAGDELLRRHFDALYLFFRTKLEGAIDDLIQATMLACVEGRERFRGEATFRVYLLGIARNQLLRHLRQRYRAGRVFAPAQTSLHEVAPALETSLPGKLARGRDRKLLLESLRRLPLDLQIALELRYWEGLPLSDIARIQDVPEGTVKSRLARARDVLEREMAALAGDAESSVRQTLDGFERWAEELRAEELGDAADSDGPESA